MNYLAHALLSFGDPSLLTGNMIADFVKGKQILQYEPPVQEGIRLHRDIDDFTDHHVATRRARKIFWDECGAYGGVFVDVVYDHFLANDPRYFTGDSLSLFAERVYHELDQRNDQLPDRFRIAFRYMRKENWLYGYSTLQGTINAFGGIMRRAKYLPSSADPGRIFEKEYEKLKNCYQEFMPDIYGFVQSGLQNYQG